MCESCGDGHSGDSVWCDRCRDYESGGVALLGGFKLLVNATAKTERVARWRRRGHR